MKVFPMILRFFSGSVTPFSRERKIWTESVSGRKIRGSDMSRLHLGRIREMDVDAQVIMQALDRLGGLMA